MRVQSNLKYIYKSHFKLWPRLITIKQIFIGISPQIFQLNCSVRTELYFQVFQDRKVFKIILYFLQSHYNLKIQLCLYSQVLLDKRNERCLLQEQAFITQTPTQPLGPGSRQTVRAMFSEGQDGLVDDFDGLPDFILLDDEGRGQPDDVAVRGLGQEPVVAEPQTHLPGIVVFGFPNYNGI